MARISPDPSRTAMDFQLVNFENPTEVRTFEKGRFELYNVGPTTLGRATYEPGWKWSEHVGPATGETSCQVQHVRLVMSGQAVAKMDDGREVVMRAGDFFYVPPGALLRCADPGQAEAATSALDQIARARSSNATDTRRFAGSSAASS